MLHRILYPLVAAGFVSPLWATGGHHAIDDATTLEPGECHVESWYERFRGGEGLLHIAPACKVGGVEWTLAYERARPDGAGSVNAFTPGAKVAHDLGNGWAVGGALGATYDHGAGRWQTLELRLPVSWFAGDAAALHAHVAHLFERGADSVWFYGAGADVALPADTELLLEAWREANEWFGRAGLRWFLPPEGLNLDISYARSENRDGDRWVAAGLTWGFGRPF